MNIRVYQKLPESYVLSESDGEIWFAGTRWTTKHKPLTVCQQWHILLKQGSWHKCFKYKQVHTFTLQVWNRSTHTWHTHMNS